MLQLLQAFGGPGRTAVSFAPTYSMYPEYARDTSTGWLVGQRETDFALDPERARELVVEHRPSVVLLPSPNNPTGTALPLRVVEALCEAAGDGLVVVDEAYAEFRRAGTASALELLPSLRNLVVTRTMSKAFAFAGARVGYLAAAPEICDAIRVVRLPYHLSAVTQAAALAALRHTDELLGRVEELRVERDDLAAWLAGAWPRGRPERRQLRALRPLRRPARLGLAGPARRRAGPRSGRTARSSHRSRRPRAPARAARPRSSRSARSSSTRPSSSSACRSAASAAAWVTR